MKQFVFRTDIRPGARAGLGALLAGAVLLSVGLVLALALAVFGGLALLASRIRRWRARKPAAREPLVIEGQYTEID